MFRFFCFFAIAICVAGCQSTPLMPPSAASTRASTPKSAWTVSQVFTMLPDSFFSPLSQSYPDEYALISSKSARQTLLGNNPVVNQTCLSLSIETLQEHQHRQIQYEESELLPELQLCIYPLGNGDFITYLQLVHTCKGACDSPQQQTVLGFCKQYDSENNKWNDYSFETPNNNEVSSPTNTAAPLFLLTPKGICLRSAFESFTNNRHRQVNSSTDVARMVWETDACRIWTGKSFE